MKRLLLLGVALGYLLTPDLRADVPTPTLTDLVARLTSPDSSPLRSYRAKRWLSASTRGGSMSATLTAWTSLDADGFTYDVIDEQGSKVIRNRVLRAALAAERDAISSGTTSAALTTANYDFLDVARGPDGAVRLQIRPRRSQVTLIDGALTLDEASGDLLAIEGRPAKRPSFWTRSVTISRRYARIAGTRVPVLMDSRSTVLVVGASAFSMRFCYAAINDVPLDPCADAPVP